MHKIKNDDIFKKGSVTFYKSSSFFPYHIQKDINALYSFVRTVDDFVDSIPQNTDAFYSFSKEYEEVLNGKETRNNVIADFVELYKRMNFKKEWVDSFMKAMESDLYKTEYNTYDETLEYIYGSAEVIGLFINSILKFDKKLEYYAQMLGRSYQLINFIRDIGYDLSLGRTYFPHSELSNFELIGLDKADVIKNKSGFIKFIRFQIDRFLMNLELAEVAYKYFNSNILVAVKTASDMYRWTAKKIYDNPFLVYEKIIKPPKYLVVLTGIINNIKYEKLHLPCN